MARPRHDNENERSLYNSVILHLSTTFDWFPASVRPPELTDPGASHRFAAMGMGSPDNRRNG